MNDLVSISTTYVLALHHVRLPVELATDAIGRVLGVGTYEARLKANVASPGPVVAATSADEETLEIYAETLSGMGVPAFVIGNSSGVQPFVARRIAFGDRAFVVESRDGGRVEIPYSGVDLCLRGIGMTDFETTQTETSRKLSMGRAVLSGGLLITKKVETVRSQTTNKRSGFLLVHLGPDHAIALDEEALQYDGLGDDMKATRSLNFAFVCQRIKAACPDAVYDEQLINRARQVQMLGPKLSPEMNLDLLTSLLTKSLRS